MKLFWINSTLLVLSASVNVNQHWYSYIKRIIIKIRYKSAYYLHLIIKSNKGVISNIKSASFLLYLLALRWVTQKSFYTRILCAKNGKVSTRFLFLWSEGKNSFTQEFWPFTTMDLYSHVSLINLQISLRQNFQVIF